MENNKIKISILDIPLNHEKKGILSEKNFEETSKNSSQPNKNFSLQNLLPLLLKQKDGDLNPTQLLSMLSNQTSNTNERENNNLLSIFQIISKLSQNQNPLNTKKTTTEIATRKNQIKKESLNYVTLDDYYSNR